MALQRIDRMRLSDYRAFEAELCFDFTGGLTIIHGPNGSGKTSVLRAIRDALTTDERDGEVYRIRSGGLPGQDAVIDLEFTAGDEGLRIRKRFTEQPAATSELFEGGEFLNHTPLLSGINATRAVLALVLPLAYYDPFRREELNSPLSGYLSAAAIRDMQMHLDRWLMEIPDHIGRVTLDRAGSMTTFTDRDGRETRIELLSGGRQALFRRLHWMAEAVVAADRGAAGSVILMDVIDHMSRQQTEDRIAAVMMAIAEDSNIQFIVTSNRPFPTGASSLIDLS